MRNGDIYAQDRHYNYQVWLRNNRRTPSLAVEPRVVKVMVHDNNRLFGASKGLVLGAAAISGAATIEAAPSSAHTTTSHHRKNRWAKLWSRHGVTFFATFLIVAGLGLAAWSYINNMQVQEQIGAFAEQVEDSGEVLPSGVMLPDCSHITDPSKPKRIQIDSLGIVACTTEVGINSKGNIGSPANIKNTSWYNGSSSPADNVGSAIMVGHIGTEKYPGILADLYKVKEGADIVVTMGDDKTYTYTVTGIQDIDSDEIEMAPYLERPSDARLMHIITCAGDYNARVHSYTHRLVVSAVEKHSS